MLGKQLNDENSKEMKPAGKPSFSTFMDQQISVIPQDGDHIDFVKGKDYQKYKKIVSN